MGLQHVLQLLRDSAGRRAVLSQGPQLSRRVREISIGHFEQSQRSLLQHLRDQKPNEVI